MEPNSVPLIFGFAADENGQVRELDWTELSGGCQRGEAERVWLHLNRLDPGVRAWLTDILGVDPFVVDILLQEDTRPRSVRHDEGWLINLRGVNYNPGPQADAMIALRIWVTEDLLITTRALKIRAAEDLAQRYREAAAPASHGAAISYLASRLVSRIEPSIDALSDKVDAIDEKLASGTSTALKSELSEARRAATTLRRYLQPQKEALSALFLEHGPVFFAR